MRALFLVVVCYWFLMFPLSSLLGLLLSLLIVVFACVRALLSLVLLMVARFLLKSGDTATSAQKFHVEIF